ERARLFIFFDRLDLADLPGALLQRGGGDAVDDAIELRANVAQLALEVLGRRLTHSLGGALDFALGEPDRGLLQLFADLRVVLDRRALGQHLLRDAFHRDVFGLRDRNRHGAARELDGDRHLAFGARLDALGDAVLHAHARADERGGEELAHA